MDKLKVMTIVGTRPEIIRLSRIIHKLDQFCDQCLAHTGQNYDYELNGVFFEELGIRKPDLFFEASGGTAAETIGNVIIAADRAMREIQPEAVLLLGDTNSSLAAISAKRLKIPIFHMEAGNRCFDFRVPEEINRRIVDHVSDIHLPYSTIARDYLIREGIPADQIIKTGSPMREVIQYYKKGIDSSDVLQRLSLGKRQYFVMSTHREENVDTPRNLLRITEIANQLTKLYQIPIIISTHPRTRALLEQLNISTTEHVRFMKPFGFLDYIHLQKNAKVVLSDSGTLTEESSILNFPALNLREVHERPEGFEQASVMFVGLSLKRILQGINILDQQRRGDTRQIFTVDDYAPDNVSDKILRIIQSYTDFVNNKIWRK